ncbi:glycosyltransferase, partial [Bacilli bacterium]
SEDDREIQATLEPLTGAVDLLGWVRREEFFDQVDLAVFPSVWEEPFGLVAAEAMARGVPFVISYAVFCLKKKNTSNHSQFYTHVNFLYLLLLSPN